MTDRFAAVRDAVAAGVRSARGVRALYPVSALPGGPLLSLTETEDGVRCEVRVAADRDVAAADLVAGIAAAVRSILGEASVDVRVEVASID